MLHVKIPLFGIFKLPPWQDNINLRQRAFLSLIRNERLYNGDISLDLSNNLKIRAGFSGNLNFSQDERSCFLCTALGWISFTILVAV